MQQVTLLVWIYRGGNNLHKVTQPLSGRAIIWTQAVGFQAYFLNYELTQCWDAGGLDPNPGSTSTLV